MAKDMNVTPSIVDEAISALGGGFIWKHSPQGHEYWLTVVKQLEAIRADALLKNTRESTEKTNAS